MTYAHLARYAKPKSGTGATTLELFSDTEIVHAGKRWNLRTGESARAVGFYHSGDGRYVRYGSAANEVVHPDGRIVALGPVKAYVAFQWVGSYAVIREDHTGPWLVRDADGSELGKLAHASPYPAPFNPRDGRTLWLQEGTTISQHDVAARTVLCTIEATPGTTFKGIAVTRSGHVAAWQRGTDERLVVFDASGTRIADSAHRGMSIAPLGDGFVISDAAAQQFVVVDTALNVRASVPMYEPASDGFNFVVGLPSDREWVAIGGRGEWDHYGEAALVPTASTSQSAPKTKTPAVKPAKTAAKKPAAKKSAPTKKR